MIAKVGFEEIWQAVQGKVKSHAFSSLPYHDAQDVISEFMIYMNRIISEKKFNNQQHMEGYLVTKFKSMVIDFVRKRNRRDKLKVDLEPASCGTRKRWCTTDKDSKYIVIDDNLIRPLSNYREHVNHMDRTDVMDVAYKMGLSKITSRYLRQYSYREIADQLQMSTATVSRSVHTVMRRVRHLDRLRYECDDHSKDNQGNSPNRREDNTMSTVAEAPDMTARIKGNKIEIIDEDDKLLAVASVDKEGEIKSLVIKDKGAKEHRDDILELAEANLDRVDQSASKIKTKGKASAKKTSKKEAPKVDPSLKAKKALDLKTLKDIPGTIEGWQKKCGGKGYCLGGSGQPVARKFKPGYDAKLKSTLKRIGNGNAKKLAKALGWKDKINWA